MSFDLELVSRNDQPAPTMTVLTQWAESQPHITIENEGNNGTLGYENYDTGVYFTIHRSDELLHLNINYCRPTFFAIETAAVISKLVAEFSLLVKDLSDDDEKPTEYDTDTLITWWKIGNLQACEALRSLEQSFPWLEEKKATELWRYKRDRSEIEEEYDDYFVPKVVVVQLDNQVLRGAHLTKPTFYVVPPVDFFWLQNNNIVWADRVLRVLKPYLTELEGFEELHVVSENTCFDTDVMDIWDAMYDSLTPDSTISQIEGKALAMDGFVDVS
jgi:hypothetical protein